MSGCERHKGVTGNLADPPAGDPPDAVLAETHSLLEASRTKWKNADWAGLTGLREEQIEADEDRGKVAILVAAAHAQSGDMDRARHFARQAAKWGCHREIMARVLISSVHNSLARAALGLRREAAAQAHFEQAISLVEPRADIALLTQVRRTRESIRMGLFPEAAQALGAELDLLREKPDMRTKRLESLLADIEVLQTALQTARRRGAFSGPQETQQPGPVPRQDVAGPFVVVAAGVPRSGSTWLFNAVRLICENAGISCYAEWCEDYDPQAHADSKVHLVKLHIPKQLNFECHRILTSHRDLIGRLASLIRMGWLEQDVKSIKQSAAWLSDLDFYWAGRSNLEVEFTDITERPAALVMQIATILDMECTDAAAATIAKRLADMPSQEVHANSRGHDSSTLLHPGHRATAEQHNKYVALVRDALANDQHN